LDGKGCYTWEEILAGRDRLPWEQVEAARRAEAAGEMSQRYEGTWLARKPERQPPKCLGGWHTGSVAKPGRRPVPTSCAYQRVRGTGQAPCYAVERFVSPVRVHSPVRYIPAPRIGRAKVGIEPDAMKPALHIWSPVCLLGPAYMAPALRMVSLVRQHSPVRPVGLRGAFNQVRLGRLGAQELQCACTVRSIQYQLHTPALRWQPPTPG
jgi:hypothetical protein